MFFGYMEDISIRKIDSREDQRLMTITTYQYGK